MLGHPAISRGGLRLSDAIVGWVILHRQRVSPWADCNGKEWVGCLGATVVLNKARMGHNRECGGSIDLNVPVPTRVWNAEPPFLIAVSIPWCSGLPGRQSGSLTVGR